MSDRTYTPTTTHYATYTQRDFMTFARHYKVDPKSPSGLIALHSRGKSKAGKPAGSRHKGTDRWMVSLDYHISAEEIRIVEVQA